MLGATTGAGLRLIESDPDADPAVVRAIQQQARARVNRSWERLGTLGPGDDETQRDPGQAALRDDPGGAGRASHPRPRRRGPRRAQHRAQPLDAEETALVWSATGPEQCTALRCDRRSASPVPASTSPPPRCARRVPTAAPRAGSGDALGAPARLRCLRKRGVLRLVRGQPRLGPLQERPATRSCGASSRARRGGGASSTRSSAEGRPAAGLGLRVCRPPTTLLLALRLPRPSQRPRCRGRGATGARLVGRRTTSRIGRGRAGPAGGSRRRAPPRPGEGGGRRRWSTTSSTWTTEGESMGTVPGDCRRRRPP